VGNGRNFGWPCYEGALAQPHYAAYEGTSAVCQALYALGPAAVTQPIYAYGHSPQLGASGIGGLYATDSPYPPEYQAGYFFADYGQNFIAVLRTGPGDTVTVEPFAQLPTGAYQGPVQLLPGPDGNLYYVRIGWPNGELRRLRCAGDNRRRWRV
jgi:glucose/arabinose dehydrogenase